MPTTDLSTNDLRSERAADAELPIVRLMGIPIHAVRERECVDYIVDRARSRRGGWVVTPNLDHLRRLVRERPFRELCAGATLRLADGMPLVWASRLCGTPLPERVAGSDLVVSLSRAAAKAGIPVFLLGGNPGSAVRAAQALTRRFPRLVVVGTECPEHGLETDPQRLQALGRRLQAAAPGVVYVALGSPKQELVIDQLRRFVPAAWWVGVGISFSFLAGDVRRAPRWLRCIGLEWLHRLLQEPRRLARRYLVQGVPFAVRLLAASAGQRLAAGRRP
jgi:N-acetylglucosaminyldiphosphoundecaprenol N-acetyl-beta-D-mannosaminyltransferase